MKPRIKVYLLGSGKYSFWVVKEGSTFAYLEDVYKLKSVKKAFWHRIKSNSRK